jgi:hypothetical protein
VTPPKTLLAMLLVVATVAASFAAPAMAASDVENSTVDLSDDTTGLYGEATVDNATDVTVTFYGIENGSETQLSTETLSPAAGETARSEYTVTDGDLANYSSARIVVNSTAVDVNSSDYGAMLTVSGGGGSSSGGLPMGLSWMQVGAGILVLGLGVVLLGDS